uniref:Uncharacterized protein n=1 Tax=Desulfobacca acetoxidans TaxID=60893 RepID=A0A7C3WR36_9BACT
MSASQTSAVMPERAQELEADTRERVELVRAQNLASPAAEQVDLKRAALLLHQVVHQLTIMDRREVRGLYRLERLQDLCYRLQEKAEV